MSEILSVCFSGTLTEEFLMLCFIFSRFSGWILHPNIKRGKGPVCLTLNNAVLHVLTLGLPQFSDV